LEELNECVNKIDQNDGIAILRNTKNSHSEQMWISSNGSEYTTKTQCNVNSIAKFTLSNKIESNFFNEIRLRGGSFSIEQKRVMNEQLLRYKNVIGELAKFVVVEKK